MQIFKEILDARHNQGLLRNKSSKYRSNEYASFTSNDFLGIANDKNIARELNSNYLQSSGLKLGYGASRLLVDDTSLIDELEKELSVYKKCESSLLFNSGYSANIGLFQSFSNLSSVEFFLDKLCHASIIDGVKLSGKKFHRFKHLDFKHLRSSLAKSSAETKIIVTERVFSMDGDIPNISDLIKIKNEFNGILVLDEAHASGIYDEIKEGIDIKITTFGKAFGLSGGAISSTKEIIDFLTNFARSFIYSTSLPLINVFFIKSILNRIMEGHFDNRRIKLNELSLYLRNKLRENDFNILNSNSHIIPVVIGDVNIAKHYQEELAKKKILVSLIRPPTVPKGSSRLRVVVNYDHTYYDLDKLVSSLIKIREE